MLRINHNFSKMVFAFIATLVVCFASNTLAAQTKVNILLEDDNVLIYNGKSAGYTQNQTLYVARNGQQIAQLKVKIVTDHYIIAHIESRTGVVAEGDVVMASAGDVPSTVVGQRPKVKIIGDEEPKPAAKKKKEDDNNDDKKIEKKTDTKDDKKTVAKKDDKKEDKKVEKKTDTKDDKKTVAKKDDKKEDKKAEKKTDTKKEDKKPVAKKDKDDEKQVEPKVIAREPYYSIHTGYFFLNEDLPGADISNDAALVTSVEYWVPRKHNTHLVYSVMYTRPQSETIYNGQHIAIRTRVVEYMGSLVWDDLQLGKKSKTRLPSGIYGGIGAAYRTSSSQISCSVSCEGTNDVIVKTNEGFDYLGILGIKAYKSADVRMMYSLDEGYYTIDVGTKF